MKQAMMLVAAVAALTSTAFADPNKAPPNPLKEAAQAYKEGRYEDALAALEKAYAMSPKPELHYSIGQVYVKMGRCDDAIVAYKKFLASKPAADRADLANQAIATCEKQ